MKNNKKGFTLVELVIVVAVMAVLVAVAIPTVSSIVGTAEDAVDNSNAKTIESLIKLEEAKMSNEAGTTATVGASNIDDAITEGKLGLDVSFVYDPVTGVVSVGLLKLKASSTSFATLMQNPVKMARTILLSLLRLNKLNG